jgi:putative flippase GtrA
MNMVMPAKWLSPSLLRFVLVGGAGFVVDGSILTLLSVQLGCSVYLSRLISFLSATLVTWLLNRRFVFSTDAVLQSRSAEYARYLTVQVIGALANLGLFTVLVAQIPAWKTVPVVPLFFGAIVGLVINYSGARFWVYRGRVR